MVSLISTGSPELVVRRPIVFWKKITQGMLNVELIVMKYFDLMYDLTINSVLSTKYTRKSSIRSH